MWCIFDVGTLLISLMINEFFSLHDVGSTYLTVVWWFGELIELSVLISFARKFVFQSWFFFLTEADYCCLAICPVIRLSSCCLVNEAINVRLEWNLLCPRFQTTSWLARVTVNATLWRSLILLGCFYCPTSDTFSIKKMKNKIFRQPYLGSKSGRNAK